MSPTLRSRYPGELLLAFRRDPLATLQRLAAASEGDIGEVHLGRRRVFLLQHPDLARELLVTRNDDFVKSRALQIARFLLGDGLLTSEGEPHRRQRRLLLPAFQHERIAAYAETMVAAAVRRGHLWRDGQELDVGREMAGLTLEVVAKALFGADVRREADEIGRALTEALSLFERVTNPLAGLLARLPVPGTLRMRRARRRLDATVHRILEQHREHLERGEETGDLLDMLLSARDEETGAGMSDRQVRDEAMTLFLAGHETTANALAWTWFLLSAHPEVEGRLHAEVDRVLDGGGQGEGRRAAFRDLEALPYTREVLAESMRLYPPVWSVGRQAVRDTELGGHPLPAGSTVLLSQYLLHRDPRFYPDPERFDPERFSPEASAARPKLAYLPFSAGPRSCIGMQFAWTEGILLLATLARCWRLRRTSDEHPGLRPGITLRPRRPIRLRAERR